jgi:hypothetical protein
MQYQPHSGGAYPNYYVAQVVVERATIPVCMYFDGSRLNLVLDGAGTCPTANEKASCTAGWQPGTVAQTWVGAFTTSSKSHILFKHVDANADNSCHR